MSTFDFYNKSREIIILEKEIVFQTLIYQTSIFTTIREKQRFHRKWKRMVKLFRHVRQWLNAMNALAVGNAPNARVLCFARLGRGSRKVDRSSVGTEKWTKWSDPNEVLIVTCFYRAAELSWELDAEVLRARFDYITFHCVCSASQVSGVGRVYWKSAEKKSDINFIAISRGLLATSPRPGVFPVWFCRFARYSRDPREVELASWYSRFRRYTCRFELIPVGKGSLAAPRER